MNGNSRQPLSSRGRIDEPVTRFATWNIQHGGGSRSGEISRGIEQIAADVLVLTEFRNNASGEVLAKRLEELDYRHIHCPTCTPRVNTLAVASREPFTVLETPVGDGIDGHRWLRVQLEQTELWAVYFPCGRVKRPLFDALVSNSHGLEGRPAILMGDFNTGKHLVDEVGRTFICQDAMFALADAGWTDAWRHLHGDRREYSWYSSAGNGFRIDHAFLRNDLVARLTRVEYIHSLRRRGVTDHAPLVIELQ